LQERIIWIDSLRSIGILAVILGHITSPLGYFIYSWHMPLFFFLGGFFLKYELTTTEFIKKDFNRLLIPYLIFTIAALMIEAIKRILLNRESLDYLNELRGIFIWMDYSSLINTYGFVLWFLPALFFGRLIIYLLNKQVNSIPIQTIIIFILFYVSFHVNLILGIDNALNASLFIFLGSIFYRFYQNDVRLYILPFLFLGLIYFFGIPALDIASKYYEHMIFNIIYSVSIIFILISITKMINYNSKLLALWGTNTMLLFIVHPYTNNIGHIITDKFLFGGWYFKFFISLVILHIVILIKQRYVNKGVFKYV
jgi:acyltransferase